MPNHLVECMALSNKHLGDGRCGEPIDSSPIISCTLYIRADKCGLVLGDCRGLIWSARRRYKPDRLVHVQVLFSWKVFRVVGVEDIMCRDGGDCSSLVRA